MVGRSGVLDVFNEQTTCEKRSPLLYHCIHFPLNLSDDTVFNSPRLNLWNENSSFCQPTDEISS